MIARGIDNWDNPAVLTEVASFFDNGCRLDWSRRFAERAVELEPRTIEAYLTYAFASLRDNAMPAETGPYFLTKGYELTSSVVLRAWRAAVSDDETEFEAAIQAASADPSFEAQAAVANAYSWKGKLNEAYAILQDFPQKYEHGDQAEWGAYCGLLLYLASAGKDIDTEQLVLPHIIRMIAARPDDISYRGLLIRFHAGRKDYSAAIEAARETLAHFPDDESTMYSLAGMYDKSGDIDRAMLWCARAVGAKYSYITARCKLASYYEQRGLNAVADELMREIPFANPDYHFGTMRLALYMQRTQRHEEALKWFKEAEPHLRPWERQSLQQDEHFNALVSAAAV